MLPTLQTKHTKLHYILSVLNKKNTEKARQSVEPFIMLWVFVIGKT